MPTDNKTNNETATEKCENLVKIIKLCCTASKAMGYLEAFAFESVKYSWFNRTRTLEELAEEEKITLDEFKEELSWSVAGECQGLLNKIEDLCLEELVKNQRGEYYFLRDASEESSAVFSEDYSYLKESNKPSYTGWDEWIKRSYYPIVFLANECVQVMKRILSGARTEKKYDDVDKIIIMINSSYKIINTIQQGIYYGWDIAYFGDDKEHPRSERFAKLRKLICEKKKFSRE